VGKTHEEIVKRVPEAAKVPVAKREQTKDMPPGEVVKFYSENEMLGKLPSGEPFAADLVDAINRAPVTGASLPKESRIRFFPQSELAKDPNVRSVKGYFSADIDRHMNDPKFYPGISHMLENLRVQNAKNPLSAVRRGPEPVHLGTLAAPEGVGSQGYQMAYDMIRGSGDLNVSDALTSRNILRRPLNVANTYYSRKNFENLMPVSERGTGLSSENLVSRVHGAPGSPGDQQHDIRQYLAGLFGREDLLDPELTKLMQYAPQLVAKNALKHPQGMAGYLELLNAVRAAQMRIPGFSQDIHPADIKSLKAVADPVIKGATDRSGFQGGLGPGALGRARTTEEAVLGQRMGMTPEEIAERILRGSKDPSREFAGRYRKGGLAALA
jgi:hypothetical protein